jgi:translation initiation factor eIF-2B subunit epsilon
MFVRISAHNMLRNAGESRVHLFEDRNLDIDFYRCLRSESIDAYAEEKHPLSIPTETLSKHSSFLLRNDLYDCNIDICTPEVSQSWPYRLT